MSVVEKIQVTIATGNPGTDGNVYLACGGREFLLDTPANNFQARTQDHFVLGQQANVNNSAFNDPQASMPLVFEDLGSFPAYIRFDGGGNWEVTSVSVLAQAGVRAVGFTALGEDGRRLTLGGAEGRRLFLKRQAVNVSAFTGNATVTVGGLGTVVAPFQATLTFTADNTRVAASFDDVNGTILLFTITARQTRPALGTFVPSPADPQAGRLDLSLPLRAVLPPSPIGIGNDSDIVFPLTTETAGGLTGARLNRTTGHVRLVGTASFQNGDLNGKVATIDFDGTVNPVF
jgi:hypothetical protein